MIPLPLWMLYSIGLGFAFALAAASLEQAFGLIGRARRSAWLVALSAGALLPLVMFVPGPSPVALPAVGQVILEVQESAMAAVPGLASGSVRSTDVTGLLEPFGKWFPYLWAAASSSLALFLLAISIRSRLALRRWERSELAGTSVFVSADVGPAVIGVWAPRVVVPAWTRDLSERQQRMLLVHELEHIRARDPLVLFAGLVVLAALPWNVVLWWIYSRLRLAIEMDCDTRVLQRYPDAAQYGSLLLEVARRASRRVVPLAAFAEARTPLHRRIRTMIAQRPPYRRLRAAAFGAAAFALAMAGCLAPRPPASPTLLADTWGSTSRQVASNAGALGTLSPLRGGDGSLAMQDSVLAALQGFGCRNRSGENLVDILVADAAAARQGDLEVVIIPAGVQDRITVEFRPNDPEDSSHARCIGDAPHHTVFFGSSILDGHRPQFTITTHTQITIRVRTPGGRLLAGSVVAPTGGFHRLTW